MQRVLTGTRWGGCSGRVVRRIRARIELEERIKKVIVSKVVVVDEVLLNNSCRPPFHYTTQHSLL